LWRKQIRDGRLLGPRIVAAGVVLDGPEPWPGTLGVSSPGDARRKVDSLRRAGVDFIKITSGMPRHIYDAVAAESRRWSLPFVGHAASGVSAQQAARAGQRSLEHLTGLPDQCVSAGRCSEVFDAFVEHGTWAVPTLVAWRHLLFRADSAVSRAPELRYVQLAMRQRWDSVTASARHSARERETARKTFERFLRVVRDMNRAGVRLLAGSDAANPYTVPGFDLHEELEWLVTAGLSPAEALRAATISPVIYLGATDSLGTVVPGKIADLVLLEANPLDDIRHTKKIAAVIVNGRLIADPARLLVAQTTPGREDLR
jgi:imidazolonepropionase-like amidohydrolase